MKHIVATLVALVVGIGISFAQVAEPPDARINPISNEIEIADPVWADNNYDIRYVVNPGRTSTTFDLTSHPADDLRPRLAIAANGEAWVVWWRDVETPQILVRSHDHATDTWSEEIVLGDPGAPGLNPEVVHDGVRAWVAYEEQQASEIVIKVGAIDDTPDPFGVAASISATDYDGELDLQLHAKAGHLWASWIDSDSEVGFSVYDDAAVLWSSPAYESYLGTGKDQALLQIETGVLGE